MLKDDPIISIDYMKIINLIKQKKLLENSTNLYDPTAAVESHHYDLDKANKILEMREEMAREAFTKHYVE